ncbi:uncharacterized protein DS421_18g624520 [Arachis hypogaea]|nr:uncharacterized protein DS421_18g624520 [Arachis hypogaea]
MRAPSPVIEKHSRGVYPTHELLSRRTKETEAERHRDFLLEVGEDDDSPSSSGGGSDFISSNQARQRHGGDAAEARDGDRRQWLPLSCSLRPRSPVPARSPSPSLFVLAGGGTSGGDKTLVVVAAVQQGRASPARVQQRRWGTQKQRRRQVLLPLPLLPP